MITQTNLCKHEIMFKLAGNKDKREILLHKGTFVMNHFGYSKW